LIPVERLFSVLGLSVVVFASTNMDDLFLLAAFFSDSSFTPRQVVAGQLLGITALVLVSAACALLAFVVPEGWIGLLGVAPLALGLRALWALVRGPAATASGGAGDAQDEPRARASRFKALAVASVTVANGGDNLGVYIPLFSKSPALIPLHAAVFAVMTGLWCALGFYLVNNRLLGDLLRRYGRIALPFVLIGLGLWILSGALVLLRG
jgi:cadmium resistance protein CadD (predicted permease)